MSGSTVGLQWVYNERKTKNERRNSALKVKVKWS